MMTLDEAIKHCSEVAEELDRLATRDEDASGYTRSHIESLKTDQSIKYRECASDHRQLSEWLRELKVHREIHDVLLQFMMDSDLDICCDDLMDDEKEQLICEENCNNKSKGCWVRWAKLKAREVNADE